MATLVGPVLALLGLLVLVFVASYVHDRWRQSRAKRTGPTSTTSAPKEETR